MKTLRDILSNKDLQKKYPDLFAATSSIEAKKDGKRYHFNDVEYIFYATLKKLIGTNNEISADPWHSVVIDWLKDTRGKSLIISGGVGIGKTMSLHAIANVVNFNKLPNVTMDIIPYYNFEFDGAGGPIRPMTAILGIDDLGCEYDKNNYGEVLNWFSKFVARNYISRNQTFVVTTNLTENQIFERYGDRTFDRLVEMCDFVKVENQESHRVNRFNFHKI